MLRKSACGMNRKVFCGPLCVHPTEGTTKATNAAAAAHRNVCVKEIMRSLSGMFFRPTYAIHVRDANAKAGPQFPPPPPGGEVRVGLTRLARGPRLGQHAGMRGGHTIISRARRLRRSATRAKRLLWSGLRNDQLGWRLQVIAATLGPPVPRGPHPNPPPHAREGILDGGWGDL